MYLVLLTVALNFQNASWSINSLKVYRKQLINGQVSSLAADPVTWDPFVLLLFTAVSFITFMH
jgi:hypothetical protein